MASRPIFKSGNPQPRPPRYAGILNKSTATLGNSMCRKLHTFKTKFSKFSKNYWYKIAYILSLYLRCVSEGSEIALFIKICHRWRIQLTYQTNMLDRGPLVYINFNTKHFDNTPLFLWYFEINFHALIEKRQQSLFFSYKFEKRSDKQEWMTKNKELSIWNSLSNSTGTPKFLKVCNNLTIKFWNIC